MSINVCVSTSVHIHVHMLCLKIIKCHFSDCLYFLSIQCYSHLTRWPDLEKAALTNIDSPWATEVWEDTYYQVHNNYVHLPVTWFLQPLACDTCDKTNTCKYERTLSAYEYTYLDPT